MRCASETSRNKCPSPSKLHGRPVLHDLEARFVMAIQQLVGNPARWPLVGQLKRLGAKPLHADHRDDLIRQNASDGGVGLEVFEASHVFHGRIKFYFSAKASPARGHALAT